MAEQMSLSKTAAELSRILMIAEDCEALGVEVPDDIVPQFDMVSGHFQGSVDRRIAFFENTEMLIEKLKRDQAYLAKKIKVIENLRDRVETRTQMIIEEMPGVEFHGSLKKLVMQKNGGKQPLKWTQEFGQIKDILNANQAKSLPEDFVTERRCWVLNRELFEEVLRQGTFKSELAELLPWGNHLRIR